MGRALLAIAIISSLHQFFRPIEGSKKVFRRVALLAQSIPFFVLVGAFLIEASSLDLVSRYIGEDLPWIFRISAVWGSRAGPLLMWAALMAVISWRMSSKSNEIPLEARIMHLFTLIILFLAAVQDPFAASGNSAGELNPLLQTELMVLHPPVVFTFYSLCMATSATALAGIFRKENPSEIHRSILYWARLSFFVGTLGIGLGGLWAYTVLDWGGYWAWDPVETGSILPWLTLLVIIHARAQSNSGDSYSVTPSLALIAGALAIHSTLVTRANGVWASVHAFVGDGQGSLSSDPYVKIIQITDLSAIGIEISTYLIGLSTLVFFSFNYTLKEQKRRIRENESSTFFEKNRNLSSILLVYFAGIGLWIGSTAVFALGLAFLTLLIYGDSKKTHTQWVAAGTALMLFSSWGWIAEWEQAVAGLLPFMIIWLMGEEDETTSLIIFTNIVARNRFSRSIPWYFGSAFLLLTWVLLTMEIDSPNLLAHELYGAIFISIMSAGLAVYSWNRRVSARLGSTILAITLLLSIIFAGYSDLFKLSGNPELVVFSSVDRGDLSMFILTWLFFALPPTLHRLWKTSKESISIKGDFRSIANSFRSEKLASHIAHLGILILLIGHVMTTTLVNRSDPSHLVTLVRDEPIKHGDLELVFTGIEIIESDQDEFTHNVGDGYLGVVIQVLSNGETVDTLKPGMLRFDTPSGVFDRSETDRMTGLSGDTIFIFDRFQSDELLDAMMYGKSDDIDRVRVTVYNLHGSHLVWIGWIFVMIGGSLAVITNKKKSDNELD